MALPSDSDFPKEVHYRRGTVMGLTVAEAFMVVAFILMMMLLFWRIVVEEEMKDRILPEQISPRIIGILTKDPQIEQLVLVFGRLGEDTLRKLGDLVRRRNVDETIAVAEGLSESDLNVLRHHEDLEAVAKLAERFRATGVPIEKIEDLADVLREQSVDNIQGAAKLAERFRTTRVPIEKIEDLADALREQSVDNIQGAAKLAERFRATGIPIEKVEDLADMLRKHRIKDVEKTLIITEKVGKILIEEDRAREKFVAELKRDLGAEIRAAKGRIDEFDGTITFPENALFPVGGYNILPNFLDTLNKMCPVWLEKLRKFGSRREIEEILIEGHSSSEWRDASTKRDAWILNLELSQRRAQSVLEHCLQLVEGSPSGDWFRAKLGAIGYSSSRPVLEDGQESVRKSRRAVFKMRLSREQLRKEIREELKKGGGDVAQ